MLGKEKGGEERGQPKTRGKEPLKKKRGGVTSNRVGADQSKKKTGAQEKREVKGRGRCVGKSGAE